MHCCMCQITVQAPMLARSDRDLSIWLNTGERKTQTASDHSFLTTASRSRYDELHVLTTSLRRLPWMISALVFWISLRISLIISCTNKEAYRYKNSPCTPRTEIFDSISWKTVYPYVPRVPVCKRMLVGEWRTVPTQVSAQRSTYYEFCKFNTWKSFRIAHIFSGSTSNIGHTLQLYGGKTQDMN